MNKLHRSTVRVLALAAAVTVGTLGSSAWAQSGAARVTNQVYGYYYANTALSVDIGTTHVGDYSNTQYFLSPYDYNFGTSVSSTPAAATFSVSSYGNAITSPSTVTMDARAGTTWGANHVYASLSGFDPYNPAPVVTTLCPTMPGSGICLPGFPEQTQTLTSSNTAYANAYSRWEEIYQTGGGAGALTTTFNVHVTLGSASSGSGTPSGSSSFNWYVQDFNNNTVAQFYAGYDAGSDSWYAGSFSNIASTGGWHYYAGSGALTIGGTGGMTLTSWDGATFDGAISGKLSFATGDVVYVSSTASAYVNGNGLTDAEHTVTMSKLVIPTGVRIFAQSGTNYAGVASGGGGGGGICLTSSCVGGGGGGGGNPLPVPEPETYALMLAGLGLLGFIARRRNAA